MEDEVRRLRSGIWVIIFLQLVIMLFVGIVGSQIQSLQGQKSNVPAHREPPTRDRSAFLHP